MRRILYSIVSDKDFICQKQWIRSIQSLRRYNRNIAVHLFHYDTPTADILREADRQHVWVHALGDYGTLLATLSNHASILKMYPCLNKIISLSKATAYATSQLLYLDCDTFFFDDVDILFNRYTDSHLYAREEPNSRRSKFATNDLYVDERALKALFHSEGLYEIWPFNSGVVLLNHGIWHAFDQLNSVYLETAWRLLVGRQLAIYDPKDLSAMEMQVRERVLATITDLDRSLSIPYPSNNHWNLDQIALWLTLGRLPITQGMLERQFVVQGGNLTDILALNASSVVAHYFTRNEERFRKLLAIRVFQQPPGGPFQARMSEKPVSKLIAWCKERFRQLLAIWGN